MFRGARRGLAGLQVGLSFRSLPRRNVLPTGVALLASASVLGSAFYPSYTEEEPMNALEKAGQYVPGLPELTREEVKKHDCKETGIWVTYREGVFDITSFVVNHPGGIKRIMLAAGGDVEGFWDIYQQHLSDDVSPFIAETLNEMRIGNLKPGEADPEELDDPYKNEPKRSPALKVHTQKSFNAEPPKALLGSEWITPTELFYVRHHHPVPHLEKPEDFRLEVTGEACSVKLSLSLEDLRKLFKKNSVVVTTQCAGNRREGLNQLEATQGLNWGSGAISTAEWSGVWLRDVLKLAGVEDMDDAEAAGAKHVQFSGIDAPYDASIPIHKALAKHGDVLLAYEMNGKNLPREHGFPLRVIVPGHLGARSVKWLKRINISHEEAYSPWQRGVAYRGFGPHVRRFDSSSVDINEAPPVQELPVQSAVTNFDTGDQIEIDPEGKSEESVNVKGYAWAGGGRRVIRVDVSCDGGKTWVPATLKEGSQQPMGRAWAWVFWEADLELPAQVVNAVRNGNTKQIEVCCKATDESFNTQPESPAPIWNLRGILNNSWDRIVLSLVPEE